MKCRQLERTGRTGPHDRSENSVRSGHERSWRTVVKPLLIRRFWVRIPGGAPRLSRYDSLRTAPWHGRRPRNRPMQNLGRRIGSGCPGASVRGVCPGRLVRERTRRTNINGTLLRRSSTTASAHSRPYRPPSCDRRYTTRGVVDEVDTTGVNSRAAWSRAWQPRSGPGGCPGRHHPPRRAAQRGVGRDRPPDLRHQPSDEPSWPGAALGNSGADLHEVAGAHHYATFARSRRGLDVR